MARPIKQTPARIKRFLDILNENGGIVAHAATQCGISRQILYVRRDKMPHFRKQWDEAVLRGSELLEDTARMRAIHGVKEAVYHQGVEVGTVTRYSDYLLWRLLQGHRPERYRERYEITGAGGGPIVQVVAYMPENGRTVNPPKGKAGA